MTDDPNNSRFIDLHKSSRFEEVDAAISALFAQLPRKKKQRGAQAAITKQHLRTLVLDLFDIYTIDSGRWLGYPRSSEYFKKLPDRYNALQIRRKRLCRLVDDLHKLGFVDRKKGFRRVHSYEQGRLSRVRAKPELIELMGSHGVNASMIERCDHEETIILRARRKKKKDRRGDDIDYEDTSETKRMRANLRRINELLKAQFIDLYVPDSDIPPINDQLRRKKDSMPFEPSRKRLKRIFNNSSFEQGGRFYGAWWQEIPNDSKKGPEWRRSIRINGFPTCEIDYSGMHLVMLYAQAGKPIPDGDPYELDGYEEDVRDFMKIALNTLLNASNEDEAIGAMINDAKDFDIINTQKHMRELLQKFRRKHSPIKNFFHRGVGIQLQCWDSAVAEQVMLTLAENGIAALPIHDSFIVRTAHWVTVHKAMELWFEKICRAGVQAKLTSPERFMAVLRANEVDHPILKQHCDEHADYFARESSHEERLRAHPPKAPQDIRDDAFTRTGEMALAHMDLNPMWVRNLKFRQEGPMRIIPPEEREDWGIQDSKLKVT